MFVGFGMSKIRVLLVEKGLENIREYRNSRIHV